MASERVTTEPASLVTNSTSMLMARIYGLAVGGVLSVLAARTFSVESFGYYSIALSLVAIFGMLSEAGLGFLAMRRFSEEPDSETGILGVALSAEVLTSLAAVALMVPISVLLGYPAAVIGPVAIGALVVCAQGFISPIDALFHVRRTVLYSAIAVAVAWTVTAIAGLAALLLGGGPAWLVGAMAAGYAAGAIVGALLMRAKTGVRATLARGFPHVLRFIRASVPIAAAGAVAIVYQRVDVLIVSKLESAAGAALYNVPLTLVQFFLVVPSVVGGAYFPILSAEVQSDPTRARSSFLLLNRIFLLASAFVALLLTFAAAEILTLLVGQRYNESSTTLAILAWTIPMLFLQQLYWYALLARYQERTALAIAFAFLVVNVALNAALIPRYGIEGAAVGLLLTDIGITMAQATALHLRHIPLDVAALLAKPLVAAVPAVALGVLLDGSSGVLAGTIAATVFAVANLAMRYVSRQEWEPLLAPLRALRERAKLSG
jgi:O-antigen/teichoic acid export membrane protein